MGRLLSIALTCALGLGCSGNEDRPASEAGSTAPIPTPDDPTATARTGPLETLLYVAPRLEGTRAQALLLAGAGTILARSGRGERAVETFRRAAETHPDESTVSELALRACEAGLYDLSLEIAGRIQDDAIRGDALSRVVDALVAAGEIDRADQAAKRLTAARWIGALAEVAEGYARAGRKTEAAGALRRALEVREAQGEEIVTPGETAELARVCALVWSGETSEKLFEEALDRVAKRVRGNPAAEARRTAAKVEIIGALAAADEFRAAIKLAEKIKVDLRRVQALVAIAIAYRERGRMKLGFDQLGAAIEIAWKMRPSCDKVVAITEVTVGYARISATDKVSGTADQALRVLRKVKSLKKQICPETGPILSDLSSAGACDAIWRHIDLIDDVQRQIEIMIANGGGCLEERVSRDAVRMLIRADELVTAHGLGDNAPKWAELARQLARAGERDKALAVAAKIDLGNAYRVNALAWILEEYLKGVGSETGSDEERLLLEKVWALMPEGGGS
jgi:tetratricopeptide (TPR) repeat protein